MLFFVYPFWSGERTLDDFPSVANRCTSINVFNQLIITMYSRKHGYTIFIPASSINSRRMYRASSYILHASIINLAGADFVFVNRRAETVEHGSVNIKCDTWSQFIFLQTRPDYKLYLLYKQYVEG